MMESNLFSDYELIIEYLTNSKAKSTKFDICWYKDKFLNNLDIGSIYHFLTEGVNTNCNPNPYFDCEWYKQEYSDVDINPFIHYLKYGYVEGRLPKLYSLSELRDNDLKLSLKGKSDYYFLINDSNNEILQHFDENYPKKFDYSSFSEDIKFKINLFNEKGGGHSL